MVTSCWSIIPVHRLGTPIHGFIPPHDRFTPCVSGLNNDNDNEMKNHYYDVIQTLYDWTLIEWLKQEIGASYSGLVRLYSRGSGPHSVVARRSKAEGI